MKAEVDQSPMAICTEEAKSEENVRTHTDEERPYECTFCSKKFKHKADCDKHVQTHSQIIISF